MGLRCVANVILDKGEAMTNEKIADDQNVDDIASLQAENDALRAQLETKQNRGPLWRRIIATILAVLAIVAVVAAVDAVWLKTTLQDEDQFVSTLQPLTQDEAVATALSVRVTDGVIEVTGVEAFVAETLPEGLAFVAAPLADSIGDLISGTAQEVIQSDAVNTAWTGALRVTHKATSAVLSGNDRALVAEGGQVGIDLDEIASVVVEQVEATGIDLPEVDLTLGTLVIYESDQLAEAQSVAAAIETTGWFVPLVALVLIALAIWVATDRRWMTAFLGFGTAIALFASLAALRITRNATVGSIEDEIQRNAAEAVWDTLLARLIQVTWALLVLALIVGLIAWLMGPSTRAHRFRVWGGGTVDRWRKPGEEEPSGFAAFLMEWKRTIQVLIVVLALLFILLGPTPSGLLVLVVALVAAGLMVLVEVLAGPAQPVAAVESETIDA